jgi:retron-type reverse transcriptase
MKYTNLMDKILQLGNLKAAYEKVVSNKGSAGIDGMKGEELGAYLSIHLGELTQALKEGTYVPMAVLGVQIPKDERPIPKGRVRQCSKGENRESEWEDVVSVNWGYPP